MILYHKYLELDPAGLKCKEGKMAFMEKSGIFNYICSLRWFFFLSAYCVLSTNVREIIKKNKTSLCS